MSQFKPGVNLIRWTGPQVWLKQVSGQPEPVSWRTSIAVVYRAHPVSGGWQALQPNNNGSFDGFQSFETGGTYYVQVLAGVTPFEVPGANQGTWEDLYASFNLLQNYTPADAGFFAGALIDGKINLFAAMDIMVANIKQMQLPTDTIAPTISNVAVTDITETTAIFERQIDEEGAVYWAVYPSATAQKTKSEILAGTGAVYNGGGGMTANDLKTSLLWGLAAGTSYSVHYFASDTAGNETVPDMTNVFTTAGTFAAPVEPDWNNISGAQLVFRGSAHDTNSTSVSTDNAYVTQFAGLSGSEATIMSPHADYRRPTYHASGGPANRPYMAFTGHQMLRYDFASNITGDFALYFVIRQRTPAQNRSTMCILADNGYTGSINVFVQDTHKSVALAGSNTFQQKSPQYFQQDWHLFSIRRVGDQMIYSLNDGSDDAVTNNLQSAIQWMILGGADWLGETSAEFDLAGFVAYSGTITATAHEGITEFLCYDYALPIRPFGQFFGDSITEGYDARYNDDFALIRLGYTGLLRTRRGIDIYNWAISGTTIGTPRATEYPDLEDIYLQRRVRYKPYAKLVFAYGTNDWPAGTTPTADWITQYKARINYFVGQGFQKSNMCIVGMPKGNINTNNLTVNNMLKQMAIDLAIPFADVYQKFDDYIVANNITDTSTMFDTWSGLHPLNQGHELYTDAVEEALFV